MNDWKIKPCLICKSTKRNPGENWKVGCPKHDAALSICLTSVDDGIQSAKLADLADLELAFLFENGRKGSRKSLVLAIVREIKKRRQIDQLIASCLAEETHRYECRRIYSENPARAAMFKNRGITSNS